jgi:D-glycero-alpha-D-manno-heptose-7-phosphate kinase
MEMVRTIEEISHPAVREPLRFMKINRGIEIHHDGDLPARSGMGSSSAFTVGILHALHALKAKMPGKEQLAREAIHVEQDRLKEMVGSQDQVLAAYGGLNKVDFFVNGAFTVRPMILSPKRMRQLSSHLMLFYTGIKRTASDVASSFVNNLHNKENHLKTMRSLVDEAVSVLSGNASIREFGRLMNENWKLKRSLSSKISNPMVEQCYEGALSAGALGGKLTGAGGGGFLLLFVPPDCKVAVRKKLEKLIHVPFRFEFSGSQIIFNDPDRDYIIEERFRDRQTVGDFRELADMEPNA